MGWRRIPFGDAFQLAFSPALLVAAMAHVSFNAFVQTLYGISFVGTNAWFIIGDYGVLTIVVYLLLTVWLYWSGNVGTALQSWSGSSLKDAS